MKSITISQLKSLFESHPETSIIDVRSLSEFNAGHIPGAINLPVNDIIQNVEECVSSIEDKLEKGLKSPIYIVCHTDQRSQLACIFFEKYGFTDVVYLKGGTVEWINSKGILETS